MDTNKDTAIELPASKIVDAAHLLSRSFHDDPMTVFLYPAGENIPYQFYILNVEHALMNGRAFTTPSLKGVAVWRYFGNEVNPATKIQNDPRTHIKEFLDEKTLQKLMLIGKATNSMHQNSVVGMHYYLFFLAVEPEIQGKGIGSLLIQPMLQIANKKRLPCYLETMREKNLAFYAKHGFQICSEMQVPEKGPHIWGLIRHPN
jgi:GNAT superfamily N-acetyltransferase